MNLLKTLKSSLALTLMLSAYSVMASEKPNILFIFADDQCSKTINTLGNKEIITPNIDHLVESGTYFSNTYNMGSWSAAICTASRTMLNCGMTVWNANKAVKELGERAEQKQMWGNLMETAGYETYMTGKWHVKAETAACFKNVGTERGGMPNQTPEGYQRPKDENDTTWQPWDKQFDGFWKGGKHWSEIVADETIGFIDDASNQEKPFFMYVAFNAPHDPRQSPKRFVDMYPLENISVPENFLTEHPEKQEMGCYIVPGNKKGAILRDENLAPFPRTEYAVKVNRQEYYAIITHLDEQIGRILDALEKSGKADNTYIFYSADHGLSVGQHGLIGKQSMYEHSMKPPLIVVGPNIPKNKVNDGFVYLQDIMASSLELADIEKPDYVEFRSLIPLTQGKKSQGNYSSIYGAYLNLQRMVRVGDYKLILYPEASKAYLFNVKKDPLEMKNLADLPKYKAKKDELFEVFFALQKHYHDELVINQSDY